MADTKPAVEKDLAATKSTAPGDSDKVGAEARSRDSINAAQQAEVREGSPVDVDAQAAFDSRYGLANPKSKTVKELPYANQTHVVSDGGIGPPQVMERAAAAADRIAQRPALDPTPKPVEKMTAAERLANGIPLYQPEAPVSEPAS